MNIYFKKNICLCNNDLINRFLNCIHSPFNLHNYFYLFRGEKKKTFLPFLANELFSTLNEQEQHYMLMHGTALAEQCQKSITFSAFEIQDEVISDLLKPERRGLNIVMTTEDGMIVRGLQRELISDEVGLRKALFDACENRVSHSQPVGGNIDTSIAVFQLDLVQLEKAGN